MNGERLPPHDIDAEEAVLGSLLVDGETIFKVAPILAPDHFYREKNRWAYEACFGLYERNEAINQVTVAHELGRQGRLEGVGGAPYLGLLISQVPTSVHAEYYAQIVRRTAVMRQLIGAGRHIEALGYESGPDVDATLDRAEDILFRLRRGESPRDFVHISAVLRQYFVEMSPQASQREGPIPYIASGFLDLDNLLGGLQRSDLVVLAARPSLGKSTLALNIARNCALSQGARVGLFSLEMAKEQVVQRLLACESGVDSRRLRLGPQTDREERQIIEATGVLSEAPIYVDDSPVLGVVEMRGKARRLQMERGLDLIVVDYLQLLHSNRHTDNRVQEISDISRALKALAREMDVPVLALSQLSRAVEARPEHRPILSDLRESGSIEQDADVVMFIYRDDVYYTPEAWEQRKPGEPYPKGITDIMVAKHRHGPTGKVQIAFEERIAKFRELALEQP